MDLLLSEKQDIKIRIKLLKNKKAVIDSIGQIMDLHNSIVMSYGKLSKDGKIDFNDSESENKCKAELNKIPEQIKTEITIFNFSELNGLDGLKWRMGVITTCCALLWESA